MLWLAWFHSSSHQEVLSLLSSLKWSAPRQQWIDTKFVSNSAATQPHELEEQVLSKANGGKQAPPGLHLQYQTQIPAILP